MKAVTVKLKATYLNFLDKTELQNGILNILEGLEGMPNIRYTS